MSSLFGLLFSIQFIIELFTGTFTFAPFATYLLENFDWKNANLILAGLILNCGIFGALMRPLT